MAFLCNCCREMIAGLYHYYASETSDRRELREDNPNITSEIEEIDQAFQRLHSERGWELFDALKKGELVEAPSDFSSLRRRAKKGRDPIQPQYVQRFDVLVQKLFAQSADLKLRAFSLRDRYMQVQARRIAQEFSQKR